MISRTTVLAAVLLVASTGMFAQTAAPVATRPAATTAPAGAAADLPAGAHVGVIAGANVYVRSGPGDAYPVARLSNPDTVQVVGEQFGWAKILPPEGTHSLVAKQFVSADGNVGVVKGDNVMVRAGSGLPQWRTRTDQIQAKLNSGQTVTILGEDGQYYKIVPPPGVFLWVSSQYIQPAPAGTPAPKVAVGPGSPAVTVAHAPSPVPGTPATPAGSHAPPVTTAASGELMARINEETAAFEAAEAALKAEFAKPRDARDLQAVLMLYQNIKLAPGSALAPYVQARQQYLQGELDLAKDIRQAGTLTAEAAAEQARLAQERSKIKVEAPTTKPVTAYAAEGVLAVSALFPGGATGPKRYSVTDPDLRVITAYVQAPTAGNDLDRHLGARVGVIGKPRYDEGTRMYIIIPEQITVLAPAPPPAPKVAPRLTTPPPPPPPVPPTVPIAPKVEPATVPAAKVEPVKVEPATKVEPVKVEPAKVEPAKVEPTPAPKVESAPATKPEPLPATGLPVVEPSTQPTVDKTSFE